MNRSSRVATILAMTASMLACVSASASRADEGSDNTLNSAQLAEANSENVYDAIARLRPRWLTTRGPRSVSDGTPTMADVYMNGTRLGNADYLRDVRLLDVTDVRYWDAGQASARFGMGHPRGVIEISRK